MVLVFGLRHRVAGFDGSARIFLEAQSRRCGWVSQHSHNNKLINQPYPTFYNVGQLPYFERQFELL